MSAARPWHEYNEELAEKYGLPPPTEKQRYASLLGELRANHELYRACEQALKEEQERSAKLQAELDGARDLIRTTAAKIWRVRYWVDSVIRRVTPKGLKLGEWPKWWEES